MPARRSSRAVRRPARSRRGSSPRAASRVPARRDGERKRDATRRIVLERALALFQEHGVEATTMRDIAKAANLSLGAAYYYFPSKDALLLSYYAENEAEHERIAERATGDARERLATLLHGKLTSIRPQRAMLASIIRYLIDPTSPVSAFSQQTREIRERSTAIYRRALEGSGVPEAALPLAANAIWLLSMALMLVYVQDDSPGEARTHGLVEDALDLVVPLFPLLGTPLGRVLVDKITSSLGRAGIPLT